MKKQDTAEPWVDWLLAGLLSLATLGMMWRFWMPGVASDADMLMAVYRIFELQDALNHGILYPRLGINLNFGYGAPLFQFYPPLVSYSALPFHWAGLGFINAAKAVFALSLLLGVLGAYVYARFLFKHKPAAFVAAAAYLFSPYLLLVIYERGAAAELLALALLPWLFWSFHRLLTGNQRTQSHWLAGIILGLLILAHNITALFVLPAALLYSLLLLVRTNRLGQTTRLQRLPPLLQSVVIGLSVSAFYWLPAVGELRYTQTELNMLGGPADVTANLVAWTHLLQTSLFFDYWGETRFRFPWWQAGFALMAILMLPFQRSRLRYPLAALAAIFLISLLAQLEISRPIWETVPLVRYIQFPWRLFGLASFSLAILIGSLFCLGTVAPRVQWGIAAGVIIVLFLLTSRTLDPTQSPRWYPIDEETISLHDLFKRGRVNYSLFTDYAPISMEILSGDLSHARPANEQPSPSPESVPTIQINRAHPYRMDLQIEAAAPFQLHFHRIYFPGWQVYIHEQPVETTHSGTIGLVTAMLPAGSYPASIRFTQTPLRRIGDGWSTAALLVGLLGLSMQPARRLSGLNRNHIYRFAILLALLTFFYATFSAGKSASSSQPAVNSINFQDELHLLGHTLAGTSWQTGETIELDLYWFVEAPLDNYRVFLHLVTPDDSARVAEFDSEPALGHTSMSRWEPGEIVTDLHHLTLADSIPAGEYLLLMGVYDIETIENLPVNETDQTLPGDRVVLAQIEIR